MRRPSLQALGGARAPATVAAFGRERQAVASSFVTDRASISVELRPQDGEGADSWIVAADLSGSGIAAADIEALLAWGSYELGLRRASLSCHADDRRSQRLAEKCGFELELREGNELRYARAVEESPDPEWKYVNVRRYIAFLEHSIDEGTQWAVFGPNDERLWARIRTSVTELLTGELESGALAGTKPEQAFFVRCDRTTMTQNDLDNGRLVCVVGVAPVRPAEFVIFRIGQWTADRCEG
jgi:tail sheath protein/GNAT acetyltransferase-like protein